MGMGVGLLVFIFFGFTAAKQLALAAERATSLSTAFQLIAMNTLTTLDILLPSALFFSVFASLARLYKNAEMEALLAAGFSPWRVLWAVFKLALIVSILVGILGMAVRPWLYAEIYRLESNVEMNLDTSNLPTGGFVQLEELEYVFIANGLDEARQLYTNVFLYQQRDNGQSSEIIHAESAKLPSLQPGEPREVLFNKAQQYLLDWTTDRDLSMETRVFTVFLPELAARQQSFKRKAATLDQLQASGSLKDLGEYQWRLSAPLITILLAMIAVPLSRVSPRESRSRNFVYALVIYVTVFSFTTAVRNLLEQGFIPPLPGLWSAYLLPLVILLILLTRQRWRSQ